MSPGPAEAFRHYAVGREFCVLRGGETGEGADSALLRSHLVCIADGRGA